MGEEQNELRWNKVYFVPAPKREGGEEYGGKMETSNIGFQHKSTISGLHGYVSPRNELLLLL